MLLQIDLQEGFHQANVEVLVNGSVAFVNRDLNTRVQTGFAESISLEVKPGAVQVVLHLLNRDLSKKVGLNIGEDTYLGFSLSDNGEIVYKISREPFRYM